MARTTFDDRARKSRIREREARAAALKMRKLDAINEGQIKTLKKIKAAEASGKDVKADSIADWHDLRAMGTVVEHDGVLTLTSIGAQVVSAESKAK